MCPLATRTFSGTCVGNRFGEITPAGSTIARLSATMGMGSCIGLRPYGHTGTLLFRVDVDWSPLIAIVTESSNKYDLELPDAVVDSRGVA